MHVPCVHTHFRCVPLRSAGAARVRRAAASAAFVLCAAVTPAATADAVDAASPWEAEAKARWRGRLDGRRFTADVTLEIRRGAWREERRLVVHRDDEGARRERLMVRFEAPADLRGVGLLYLEHADRPNDYFLYQPSLQRVRRVPEELAREDVYGVDLEYLGFGVAQVEPTELVSVRRDPVGGRPALRLTERATGARPRFDERRVWLDPRTFVPLRTEHRRRDATTLVVRTEDVRDVAGIPTPMRVVFDRVATGETVTLTVDRIDYAAPIPDGFFSALRLARPR